MKDKTHTSERARLGRKSWIQSFSGLRVEPLALKPEMVSLIDIAHALSMKCRYTGHSKKFYSVAEHSVRVSHEVPPAFAMAGLLHDATEAYLPDVAAPIKGYVDMWTPYGLDSIPFRELEDRNATVIFKALGLSHLRKQIDSEEVKRADLAMLAAEVRDIMGPPPEPWGLTVPAAKGRVIGLYPRVAKYRFLYRFHQLAGTLEEFENELLP